jgi:hypothetical protein
MRFRRSKLLSEGGGCWRDTFNASSFGSHCLQVHTRRNVTRTVHDCNAASWLALCRAQMAETKTAFS